MATVIKGPSGFSLNDIYPGQSETWTLTGYNWLDVISISAQPFTWVDGYDRSLTVTDIVAESAPDGGKFLHFTVRNVGNSTLNYGVFTSIIR
jgi:hypothetical protein